MSRHRPGRYRYQCANQDLRPRCQSPPRGLRRRRWLRELRRSHSPPPLPRLPMRFPPRQQWQRRAGAPPSHL